MANEALARILAERRRRYFEELNRDPKLAAYVRGLTMAENGGHPEGILESLMNRADMRGRASLWDEVRSGFYGPVNRGTVRPRPDSKFFQDAFGRVRSGSNDINLLTDQGMRGEHRPAAKLGIQPTYVRGEYYSPMGREGNDWRANIMKLAQNPPPPPQSVVADGYTVPNAQPVGPQQTIQARDATPMQVAGLNPPPLPRENPAYQGRDYTARSPNRVAQASGPGEPDVVIGDVQVVPDDAMLAGKGGKGGFAHAVPPTAGAQEVPSVQPEPLKPGPATAPQPPPGPAAPSSSPPTQIAAYTPPPEPPVTPNTPPSAGGAFSMGNLGKGLQGLAGAFGGGGQNQQAAAQAEKANHDALAKHEAEAMQAYEWLKKMRERRMQA